VSCIKTVQARITKSSLWAALKYLVFATKFCASRWRDSLWMKASNMGTPCKTLFCRYWLV